MKKIIVLFGAGVNGKLILNKVKDKFPDEEVCFCDNDVKKQNTMTQGVKVIEFCELLKLYKENLIDKIIITPCNGQEMLYQCVSEGIDIRHCHFWDNKHEFPKVILEKYISSICSQDGEEIFLRDYFFKKAKGIYVDVGANHPFRFSNTFWAYAEGWRGINIEPDVFNYKLLKEVRPEDININCGISDVETYMDYYVFKENALNTFCRDEIRNESDIVDIRKVPVRRMDSILKEYRIFNIDFMDIDVEGMELKVLNSINWDDVKIECILVEQRRMSLAEVLESNVCKFLKDKGYVPVNKYNRTVIYINAG
ncbi:hypothetical protein IMSAG249_02367 [Lachnospiraceae bacterium]|nr:hypothetical protein IMSAGC009_00673 [Lachnospiraceae bacterium]GFI70538.1 hypothetical protein IMSAG249_02367 [Lachnospiraceae bacterium]